jgi:hypothetical protein
MDTAERQAPPRNGTAPAGADDRPAPQPVAMSAEAIQHSIRHSTLRAVGFVGLLGIALIHLLDVLGKLKETPYLGVMYIALMLASVVVAFGVLHLGSRLTWGLGGGLAAATLLGFVLSRTTGLPSAKGDIGNWSEPLGLASMFVEGAVIALCGYALSLARRERAPGVHESLPVR